MLINCMAHILTFWKLMNKQKSPFTQLIHEIKVGIFIIPNTQRSTKYVIHSVFIGTRIYAHVCMRLHLTQYFCTSLQLCSIFDLSIFPIHI
jgi:hypothetical protein